MKISPKFGCFAAQVPVIPPWCGPQCPWACDALAFCVPQDASAAAIFQQQHTSEGTNTGMASPLKAFGRRASCEYVMSKPGSRKSVHAARASMDAAAFSAAYAKAAVFTGRD